jgi:hypothetical protein
MGWTTIMAAAATLGSSQPTTLTPLDFQALMQGALAEGAASWTAPIKNICVQRELEAPLRFVGRTSSLGWRSSSTTHFGPDSELDASLAKAMSPQVVVASEKLMPPLPSSFVLFSSKAPRPEECVIEHVPPSAGTAHHDLSVAITFTQPAFADGLAFINEVDDCPGLCGDGIVRVFKKQAGGWTQVAEAVLWVS